MFISAIVSSIPLSLGLEYILVDSFLCLPVGVVAMGDSFLFEILARTGVICACWSFPPFGGVFGLEDSALAVRPCLLLAP